MDKQGPVEATQRWAQAPKQPNPQLQYGASASSYPAQRFGDSHRASLSICAATAEIPHSTSGPSADQLLSACSTSSAPVPWWEFFAAFSPLTIPAGLKKRCSISLQSWVIFTRCNYSLTRLHSPWNFALRLSVAASYYKSHFASVEVIALQQWVKQFLNAVWKCSQLRVTLAFLFFQRECSRIGSQQRTWKLKPSVYTSERRLVGEGEGKIIPSSLKADLSSGKVNPITITALISLQCHWEHSKSIKQISINTKHTWWVYGELFQVLSVLYEYVIYQSCEWRLTSEGWMFLATYDLWQ